MDEGFAPGIGEKLRAYVYLLVDPRTGRAFFAGRGRNDRCFRHVQAGRTKELGDPGPAAVTGQAAVTGEAVPGVKAVPGVAAGPGVKAGQRVKSGPGEYVVSEAKSKPSKPSTAGRGERTFPVLERIREIESSGRSVRIDILRYGLSADEARLVEAVAQDALGLRSASSDRGGGTARAAGADKDTLAAKSSSARPTVPAQRTEATRLNTLLAKPAKIKRSHRAVLLRLGKSFGPGTSDAQVDEAVRSAWKIGRRWTDLESRRSPQWAFAVVDDVVRAVFRIDGWKPSDSTSDSTSGSADPNPPARDVGPAAWTRPSQQAASPGQNAAASPGQRAAASPPARWTLTGERDPELEQKYRGRNVSAYLGSGSQNPVTYVWCGPHWVNSPV